jgi:hypothetical protein
MWILPATLVVLEGRIGQLTYCLILDGRVARETRLAPSAFPTRLWPAAGLECPGRRFSGNSKMGEDGGLTESLPSALL